MSEPQDTLPLLPAVDAAAETPLPIVPQGRSEPRPVGAPDVSGAIAKVGGRKPDLERVSAEERAHIKAQSAGDALLEKRLLQAATRRADAEIERRALLQIPGPRRDVQVGHQFNFEEQSFEAELADKPRRAEMQYRAQTDLMFLGVNVLGYDFTERTHRAVADFFVKKNPDRPAVEWDATRRRVLLDPRNCYKTTWMGVDATQFIINDPELRIDFIGPVAKLAKSALQKFQQHFIIQDPPTRFQRLFPDFCITPRSAYEDYFNVACRKNPRNHREPTAMFGSVDSSQSGWHHELHYLDDVVDNENSGTFDRLSKVRGTFHTNVKMLEKPPHAGYLVDIGTRYAPNDLHGELLTDPLVKSLVRRAMWAKDGANAASLEKALRDPNVKAGDLNPADWELLFPERLTFAELMQERGTSMESHFSFCAQYLNDPTAASGEVTFLLEDMRRATVPYSAVPRQGGRIFIVWDLAYSQKQGRDFTVGAVMLIDYQGRLWVLEIIRGRFVPSELENRILDAMRRWSPECTDIEDSMGATVLLGNLERRSSEYGVLPRIRYIKVSNEDKAKSGRIKYLQSLLQEHRLLFCNTIDCLDDLYREFCGFPNESHDDIPDAISLGAVEHVPKLAAPITAEMQGMYADLREADLYDRMHGLSGYQEIEPEPEPVRDPYALDDCMAGLNG